MLDEEIYQDVSEAFGTSVGVAHIIGYKTKEEHIEERTTESYKHLTNSLDINDIVADAIYEDLYEELQRKLYELNKKKRKGTKEITIYKRAWKEII